MTRLAAVVMAHRDPEQVRRLVRALPDVPIALHCDSKATAEVAAAMVDGSSGQVVAVPRTSGALDSWSLVRIELSALRVALAHSDAEHLVVLSGADYPLLDPEQLHRRLEPWRGRSYLSNVGVPFAGWNGDGGRWRTEHRFWTRGDDVLKLGRIPVRNPWRRRLPAGLRVRASAQWKIYARPDAVRLLALVDARPDLVRFWRSTLVPDESFVASMLSSPEISGADPLPLCGAVPWFMRWDEAAHHPRWLVADDFDALADAVAAPPATPDAVLGHPEAPAAQAWFARKVSTETSTELLDRIDTELKGHRSARGSAGGR